MANKGLDMAAIVAAAVQQAMASQGAAPVAQAVATSTVASTPDRSDRPMGLAIGKSSTTGAVMVCLDRKTIGTIGKGKECKAQAMAFAKSINLDYASLPTFKVESAEEYAARGGKNR